MGSGPKLAGYGAQGILELVLAAGGRGRGPALPGAGVCLLVGEAGPETTAGSLVGGARAQGFLSLVSAPWGVELGPWCL